MKKVLVEKIKDLFNPNTFQELDVYEVLSCLQDPTVRKRWLYEVLSEIKRINLEVDFKLRSGNPVNFVNLSERRRGIQFVLEQALTVHREASRRGGHNPSQGFDLENVTVHALPE